MRSDGRSSFWTRTFHGARQSGDWVMVERLYTQSTAAQLTSDIINAGHRDPSTVRVRGIRPGEKWEARWEAAGAGPVGDHVVWIRFVPQAR
jgi:hypothetical protein